MKKELELYVHIPFCVKKCAYCDFLSFSAKQEEVSAYVEALAEEIKGRKDKHVENMRSEPVKYRSSIGR